MGKEQRARQQVEALGKFDIHLRVTYMDGSVEEGDYKSWAHMGPFIACDRYEGGLRVFVLDNHVKYFEVEPNNEAKKALIEAPN